MNRSRLDTRTAGAVTTREATAASSYHDLLRSSPSLGRETYEALLKAHDQHELMIRDRMLCNVLRPRFITPERLDELARISALVASLMERCGEHLLQSDRSLDLVDASEQEREIWAIDPGYPGLTLTSRLDSFMSGDNPLFVEYNAESPAGIAFTDVLTEIFQHLPVMRAWEDRPGLERFYGRERLLETLLWAYEYWGGRGTPSIAIVDWEDVVTKRDFELCQSYFADRGVPSVITDPRKLEYRSGHLWSGDVPITMVYRRVLLHELLEKAGEAQNLLRAYRDGAVCVVNSPRSKLLHKKAIFALLSDHSVGLELTEEEQSVVDASIPWTRFLVEGTTDYEGSQVNVVDFICEEKERLVLKPVDDYGGRGVVLGWETGPEEWQAEVEKRMQEHYVVQERVPQPEAEFPVIQDGNLEFVQLVLDTNPLLFRGRLGSILTRISDSALLNVTAGTGSTTPTFVVRAA
jgi:hypothetical protein